MCIRDRVEVHVQGIHIDYLKNPYRQTDRQTETETDRDRQRQRQTETETDRDRDRERQRQTERGGSPFFFPLPSPPTLSPSHHFTIRRGTKVSLLRTERFFPFYFFSLSPFSKM